MEGEQGNPGSEAGNVITSSDHAVATAPENIETVTANNENGKENARKNEEAPAAAINDDTEAPQPDEKKDDDMREVERDQEKPRDGEMETGGDLTQEDLPGRVRRERKKVEPLKIDEPKLPSSTKVMAGKGTRLRDIPNVTFKLSKITGKDELMESLHNILYRRRGTLTTRKKLILDFSGFDFEEEQEEKEMEARKSSLNKLNLNIIHQMMNVLDLNRGSGDKEAKVDRILEFLKCPSKTTDTDLGAKDAARKEKIRRKRERASAKKEKENKKKLKTSQETKKHKRKEHKEENRVEDADEEPKSTDDPSLELSTADIESAIEKIFAKFSRQQLEAVTGKHALKKLSEHYGFSMQSRKSEIVNMASSYIARRLVAEEDA